MSNIDDLLNALGFANGAATGSAFGGLLGVLADISGAAATLTVVDAFLQKNDATLSLLRELKQSLQDILDQIDQANGRGRWTDITNRWAAIDDAFTEANAVLDGLSTDLAHLEELDFAARSERITRCAHVLELLSVPERWHLYTADPEYYSDAWSGNMTPTPDSIGSVFNDSYIMAQFMRAMGIYLLILQVFTPEDFPSHQADIAKFRDVLTMYHDQSRDGVRSMSYWDVRSSSFDDQRSWTGELIFAPGPWTFGLESSTYYDSGFTYYQPFGAVHLYSGINAFGKFPPFPSNPLSSTSDLLYVKLAIASRSRWKDVYVAAGLANVWDMLDRLGPLAAAPAMGYDSARWWKLREIHSIFHQPQTFDTARGLAWLSDGAPLASATPISARDTFGLYYDLYGMSKLDPLTGKAATLSMRALLDAATLRGTVSASAVNRWWGPLGDGLEPPPGRQPHPPPTGEPGIHPSTHE